MPAVKQSIPPEVIEVLEHVGCVENKVIITQELERKLYEKTAKVLKALGGKWNRSEKATVFETDAGPIIADAIVTGDYVDQKKQYQFFETPTAIAEELCDQLDIQLDIEDGQVIGELSAGFGAIARVIRDSYIVDPICMDINPKCVERLTRDGFEAIEGDFLEQPAEEGFDRIVINPPFTRGQDMRHVRHAYDFLKPGGRLVAVMSLGWTFRQDKAACEFREWFDEVDGEHYELPQGAFKESGTMIRALVVCVDKADAA